MKVRVHLGGIAVGVGEQDIGIELPAGEALREMPLLAGLPWRPQPPFLPSLPDTRSRPTAPPLPGGRSPSRVENSPQSSPGSRSIQMVIRELGGQGIVELVDLASIAHVRDLEVGLSAVGVLHQEEGIEVPARVSFREVPLLGWVRLTPMQECPPFLPLPRKSKYMARSATTGWSELTLIETSEFCTRSLTRMV